jgi:hypothetical protein
MRWLSIWFVLAALAAAPNVVLAKGGYPLHLFPEQTASVSQPGPYLRRTYSVTGSGLGAGRRTHMWLLLWQDWQG